MYQRKSRPITADSNKAKCRNNLGSTNQQPIVHAEELSTPL